jgi:hypothetical protein
MITRWCEKHQPVAAGISIGVYRFGFKGYFQRLQNFNVSIWNSVASVTKVRTEPQVGFPNVPKEVTFKLHVGMPVVKTKGPDKITWLEEGKQTKSSFKCSKILIP